MRRQSLWRRWSRLTRSLRRDVLACHLRNRSKGLKEWDSRVVKAQSAHDREWDCINKYIEDFDSEWHEWVEHHNQISAGQARDVLKLQQKLNKKNEKISRLELTVKAMEC